MNERDELGSDLVPDYLTSVQDGGFYGWPYSYFGAQRRQAREAAASRSRRQGDQARLRARQPRRAARAGVHRGACRRDGAFVGQHGSWNRRPPSGYNVVFIPFANGRPAGQPIEVLGGFLSPEGEAYGRPVGVAIDKRGAVLVADDVGNAIWRVK